MRQVYGFNERIGQLAFPQQESGGFPEQRPYSDATAQAMDEEAKKLVDTAYQRTLELCRTYKAQIEKMAELLLEKETINHDDIVRLIGHRPFETNPQYAEYVSAIRKDEEEREKKPEDDTSEDGAAPPNLSPV